MINNQPITNKERTFPKGTNLVSVTDLNGVIQYVNQEFVEISGFDDNELIGANHNVVRHPDMPQAAFEDLWSTIKTNNPWRGMVKNRCKNGDYYWVDAYVTPVFNGKNKIGYQSVRSSPTQQQISEAEALYRKLRSDRQLKLPKTSAWLNVNISTLISAFSIIASLAIFTLLFLDRSSEYLSLGVEVVGLLAILLNWYIISSRVFKPMTALRRSLRHIASGNLVAEIPFANNDEIGTLIMTTKMVQARLRTLMGQFRESASQLTHDSELLFSLSQETISGMGQQMSDTDQVATAMEEMSATVNEVASNAGHASDKSHVTREQAQKGVQLAGRTEQAMNQLAEEVQQTSGVMDQLAEESSKISSITNTISAIAEQTNLLALNAAIEAARAGEQGRGFAVVADEVRTLASRTQSATTEIREMIDTLQGGITKAVDAMQSSSDQASHAVSEVQLSLASFQEIAELVQSINDMNTLIATAAEEQAAVSQEMSRNVVSIREQTSTTTECANHTREQSQRLTAMSQRISKQLEHFNLGPRACTK
jgi:aerotaxis receptor